MKCCIKFSKTSLLIRSICFYFTFTFTFTFSFCPLVHAIPLSDKTIIEKLNQIKSVVPDELKSDWTSSVELSWTKLSTELKQLIPFVRSPSARELLEMITSSDFKLVELGRLRDRSGSSTTVRRDLLNECSRQVVTTIDLVISAIRTQPKLEQSESSKSVRALTTLQEEILEYDGRTSRDALVELLEEKHSAIKKTLPFVVSPLARQVLEVVSENSALVRAVNNPYLINESFGRERVEEMLLEYKKAIDTAIIESLEFDNLTKDSVVSPIATDERIKENIQKTINQFRERRRAESKKLQHLNSRITDLEKKEKDLLASVDSKESSLAQLVAFRTQYLKNAEAEVDAKQNEVRALEARRQVLLNDLLNQERLQSDEKFVKIQKQTQDEIDQIMQKEREASATFSVMKQEHEKQLKAMEDQRSQIQNQILMLQQLFSSIQTTNKKGFFEVDPEIGNLFQIKGTTPEESANAQMLVNSMLNGILTEHLEHTVFDQKIDWSKSSLQIKIKARILSAAKVKKRTLFRKTRIIEVIKVHLTGVVTYMLRTQRISSMVNFVLNEGSLDLQPEQRSLLDEFFEDLRNTANRMFTTASIDQMEQQIADWIRSGMTADQVLDRLRAEHTLEPVVDFGSDSESGDHSRCVALLIKK